MQASHEHFTSSARTGKVKKVYKQTPQTRRLLSWEQP